MADDPLRNIEMLPRLAQGCRQLAEIMAKHEVLKDAAPGVLVATAEVLVNTKKALEAMPAIVARAKIATTFATYTDVAQFARAMADEIASGARVGFTAQGALRQLAAALESAVKEERHVTGIEDAPKAGVRARQKLLLM